MISKFLSYHSEPIGVHPNRHCYTMTEFSSLHIMRMAFGAVHFFIKLKMIEDIKLRVV